MTGWSLLATFTIAFSLTGILYYSLRPLVVAYVNRKIRDLIVELGKEGYEFLGRVKVTTTPASGRPDIKDDHFFVHLPDHLVLLSARTVDVRYIAGVPYRVLYANTPRKHVLCLSEGKYYLWRKP